MQAFVLAGGELAGTSIQIDETLLGRTQPLIRVPDGSGDEKSDYLLIVSKDQEWVEMLWPASRGAVNRRRSEVYHRNGNQFIFTGEGRQHRNLGA